MSMGNVQMDDEQIMKWMNEYKCKCDAMRMRLIMPRYNSEEKNEQMNEFTVRTG
jgi:hypothetical protein